MPNFKTIQEALKYAEKQAQLALKQKVAQKVVEMGKESVQENFYDEYISPAKDPYQRTGQTKEDWSITDKGESVEIKSERKGEDGIYIAEKAAYGTGWWQPDLYGWSNERDFVTPVKEELASGKLRQMMKEELRKQGLDVR